MEKFKVKEGTQFFLIEGKNMESMTKKVNNVLAKIPEGEISDWKLGHDMNGYVNLGFFYSPEPKPTELEKLVG